MPAKISLERILRDDDDASGQSIRQWKIESEDGFVMIRLRHGEGFILLRGADVDQFVRDLERARAISIELAASQNERPPR